MELEWFIHIISYEEHTDAVGAAVQIHWFIGIDSI